MTNFDSYNAQEVKGIKTDDCKDLCTASNKCPFYEFKVTNVRLGYGTCFYIDNWHYKNETMTGFDDGTTRSSCYIKTI